MVRTLKLVVLAMVTVSLLAYGPTARAAAGKGAMALRPAAPASLPDGYRVLSSAPISAASGVQTHGSLSCPGKAQPASGGALVDSTSTATAINSSYPSGQAWEVDVNNTSGAATNFTVWVICLAHNAKYRVVTSSYTAAAQSLTLGEAFCPKGSSLIGGGVVSQSSSTLENVTISDPIVEGKLGYWHVYFNDADTVSSTFVVDAICHPKPVAYSFQQGTIVSDPSGTQGEATVTCPGKSFPLGGGGGDQIENDDNAVTLNSSYPDGQEWVIYENNSEPSERDIDDQVVCSGN